MQDQTTNRITFFIAASGAVLAILTTLLAGYGMGLGAVVGALVAVANWLVLRWVVRRVMQGSDVKRSGMMFLLILKMGALMALCWILIARFNVDPIGFVVGLSSLFVGIMLGAMGAGSAAADATDDLGVDDELAEEEG